MFITKSFDLSGKDSELYHKRKHLFWNNFNKQTHTGNLAVKVKLSCFKVNVTRKNVVKNNILNKVWTIILFVIILLDACKRNRQKLSILLSILIGTLNKYCIIILCIAAERSVCISVHNKRCCRAECFGINALVYLADFPSSEQAITTEVSSITPIVLSIASFIWCTIPWNNLFDINFYLVFSAVIYCDCKRVQ